MAVDTQEKRESAVAMQGMRVLPPPDGTIDSGAKAVLLGLYSGIAATGTIIVARLMMYYRRRRR